VWKNALPDLTAVLAAARTHGQADFLVYGAERVSFDAFHRAVAALAEALALRGVGKGDRVALAMRNLPEWPVAFMAVAALGACGITHVDTASTDITSGWADAAPYDIIMLNGAAETVPDAWLEQLAEGGRLGVIVRSGAAGQARLYTKSGGVAAFRVLLDAAPPVAPGLAAKPQFAF
jgi:non-ribosomal peptide synthetase component E (peptide arylation enzyme)